MVASNDSASPNLGQLILDRKGRRSFSRLSRDCGDYPAGRRLQQLASMPMKNFPDPETILGLSRGLGVSNTDVLLAAARSLDIPVASQEKDALTIAGAAALPASCQEALFTVAREMRNLAAHGPAPRPTNDDGKAVLRPVP